MEFRSIINLSCFVNYLYFLWLSDIVKFLFLFISVTVGWTRPLMMSMNSFSCLSDTTRLLRKYHSHCLKVSLIYIQGIFSHFIFAPIPWSSMYIFKTRWICKLHVHKWKRSPMHFFTLTVLNILFICYRIHFLLHCSWIQESEHKVKHKLLKQTNPTIQYQYLKADMNPKIE